MDKRDLIEDIYPLSPVQAGILYHALEGAEPGMYFTQWIYELAGDLDLGALRQVAERVIARHTSLRTFFVWEKRESPVQVVLRKVRFPFQEHDWRDLPEREQEEQLAAFLAEDRAQGFDLSKPPLLRLTVCHFGAGRVVLVWSHHHILVDGWSLDRLFRELAALQEEITGGRPADLPPARPYSDYIAWLRQRNLPQTEQFWRHSLAGFQLPTPVPLAGASGGLSGERYPQIDCLLSPELMQRLLSFVRVHHLTLGTLIQGAWALLLARHAGLDDVVFGVTVTGRPPELDQVEAMVGLFINTLPLRVRLRPQDRLVLWLRALQAQLAEVRQHEHTPLGEVHGWSEVPRSTPLFETFVNFYNGSIARDKAPERSALRVRSSRSVIEASYPLSLGVSQEPELNLRISFDARRFDPSSVRRVQRQLTALLTAFAAGADRSLEELSLVDGAEARQVLHDWSGAQALQSSLSLPELFERAVDATPEATALAGDGLSLTYRELDHHANRLARLLRRAGVGPEVPVALCAERSPQAIVALLAVLKAGGAYLALEPGDPEERLRSLLGEARVPLLLTVGCRTPWALPGVRQIDLDGDADRIAAESGERLSVYPAPENLAYVLFTSGSTGRPKAVAVEHRQIVHYVHAVREALDLGPGLSYALVSTLAADLGHTSLYSALSGGCLVVASREVATDPDALADLFRRHHIRCLKIVPSHLNALLNASPEAGVLPMERLVLGGEASNWEAVDRLRSLAPGCRIFNHYGPTESTVGVTTYDVLSGEPGHRTCGHVPLGRALAGVRIRLLDSHGQPAPPGVAGDLCLGGAGLARGYLHAPAATAERFRPDPFSAQPGERLYRTGDRARWLPDGNLEFLGRVDHQVKIRGFRVEMGEIEAVLAEHPAVDAAVAVVRGQGAEARIVAYVTAAPGAQPAAPAPGTVRLPNGMDLFHQNEHETRALFDEIFVKRSYLQHGIRLPERDCVIDVGANIGLFSLFVRHSRPEIPIYAFEPARPVFEILRSNAELHGGAIKVFNRGLADREKMEDFTYYPFYSTQSGLTAHADSREDAEVIQTVLRNAGEQIEVETDVFSLGFEAERLEAHFERLSDILRREGIDRVGLLKIDVQRAELEVLDGIDESDWPRIEQVVVEVHDQVGGSESGRVDQVVSLLARWGFQTTVEQDALLRGTKRYNVYAVRDASAAPATAGALAPAVQVPAPGSALSAENLRSFLAERLPGHMVPAAITILERLPLTPNGKVDRKSLPDPEIQGPVSAKVLPRSPLEQELAEVWTEILGIQEIAVEDNFFDLGGHSLRAMQLITRLRRRFHVELSLREFLSSPRIASLAIIIAQKRAQQLHNVEVMRILEELERAGGSGSPSSETSESNA
jgi:amino acid adenylation domain-containing protein/FkbM family methyltransferase